MKKIYLLLIAVTVIVGLSSCEVSTSCVVSWEASKTNLSGSSEEVLIMAKELGLLDSVFTAEFGKASFGKPTSGSKSITVNGIKPKQLKDIKNESATLAENANNVLAGKTFTGCFTYTVSITDGDSKKETIATYQYGTQSSK